MKVIHLLGSTLKSISDISSVMTTPKKRLDATIASLAARVDVSPKHPRPSSPLVRTPKHSKTKTSVVTPNSKRVLACDRSQDLYKRICKGLIDLSRTPLNKKVLTPSKFFKSRTTAAPKNAVKRVPFYFCDAPVEYIKDVENMNKVGGRNRKRPSVAVEVVIPLDNIKTGVGAQDYVEVMTDIVEKIFDEATRGNAKSLKVKTVINKTSWNELSSTRLRQLDCTCMLSCVSKCKFSQWLLIYFTLI